MSDRAHVGFIGLGLMGHGMAKNIVEKGYPLTIVAHRNRLPVEDLIARGASEAATPAELASRSDIVFLCVTGSPQVEDVLMRKNGLLEGVTPGTIVADCSTAEPASTLRMAIAVEERGGRFVDTPLVRSPLDAEAGRLVVITGGNRDTLAEIQPVVETFAEIVVHAGPLGAAHTLKLINNFLALAAAASVGEAMVAAIKGGVDLRALAEIVQSGGADSAMFRRFARYVLEGDDSLAKFAIGTAAKDLRYYTHLAEAMPITAFIGEAVHQTLQLAVVNGYAERYLPHLVDALSAVNGVPPLRA